MTLPDAMAICIAYKEMTITHNQRTIYQQAQKVVRDHAEAAMALEAGKTNNPTQEHIDELAKGV